MLKRLIPANPLRGANSARRWRAVGRPIVHGPLSRIQVSPTAALANALINTYGGTVTIGDHVLMGHNVMLLTGTHDISVTGTLRQIPKQTTSRNIVIESGVWIASGVIIVGPCRIGANSVIGSGSVVNFNVPADTVIRVRQEFTTETLRYGEVAK